MTSVVVFVFDGLQPAQVNTRLMPNLSALAADGVTFANHHSIFPTVTRVNVSSIVTGLNPGGHGLAGNRLVIRDFDPEHAIPALEPELSQIAKSGAPVLLGPTLAEILSQHGKEYVAISVGTNGNAYLQNPTAEDSGNGLGGATIHPTFALPRELHESLLDRFGQWPEESLPNIPRLAHAMRVLTEYVLPDRRPAVSLIWSSEPDNSHHAAGVGSGLSDSAVKAADGQFGDLMRWLRDNGRADDTDVIAVSDHGYSTISESINVEAMVKDAGFPSGGGAGEVIVAQNGGSALFYTQPGDLGTTERLAAWLMAQPWCGAITASDAVAGIPGTLPASLVGNQGPRAPELTVSFYWDSSLNKAGYAGRGYGTYGAPGVGHHGSMSRHEMKNILFANGPSFKSTLNLDTPTGNLDLAPTILRILGISGDWGMDGRVLEEALTGGPNAGDVHWSTELHHAEHDLGGKIYRQQIKISRAGSASYVDEGNRVG